MSSMKEENFLFDVWVRMKPFMPVSSVGNSVGVNTDPLMSPLKDPRNRNKSPKINRTLSYSERESKMNQNKKPDYKAFRIEPNNKIGLEEVVEDSRQSGMAGNCKVNSRSFSFPNIINENESNHSIFEKSLRPKIVQLFEGKCFTFLTYGISGSGKSHTIFGSQNDGIQEKGLLFYFMQELFEMKKIQESSFNKNVQVSISFIEIYNEQARDLLAEDNYKKLSIIESPFTSGVVVPDLTACNLNSLQELSAGLSLALSRRVVCPNLNNNISSRSHLIVEIVVSSVAAKNNTKLSSKIRFVDLAGSEKVSLEAKDVMQEGANINKSLLSLTNCITILSDNKKRTETFVPYRNSKLTRLLKDSLSGNTPVLMIVCISPNACYIEETMNSLKYAQKAKNIKESKTNGQSIKQPYCSMNYTSQKNKIDELEREVRYLKGALLAKDTSQIAEASSQREESFTKATLSLDNIKDEEGQYGEEEIDELIEALIENVEDINSLRQNIVEIDQLISQNDNTISDLQTKIGKLETEDYPDSQKMYKELKIVADKLDDNLDLKENALLEIDKLNQTIKCTKLALKKMLTAKIVKAQPSKEASVSQESPKETSESRLQDFQALERPNNFSELEDGMITSTRDRISLLEEIRQRDNQISALNQTLKNLMKLSSSSVLSSIENRPLKERKDWTQEYLDRADKENLQLNSQPKRRPPQNLHCGGLPLDNLPFEALMGELSRAFNPCPVPPLGALGTSDEKENRVLKELVSERSQPRTVDDTNPMSIDSTDRQFQGLTTIK